MVLLASSVKQTEIDHYVALLGIGELLEGTTSADDVRRSKPAPISLLAYGSMWRPSLPAARCGVRTIALRSGGFPDAELAEFGALEICDGVGALIATWHARMT
jgi:hypothetical protein